MDLLERFDPEILEYIKEIATRMKNNRASVMVGAGFSKNAKKYRTPIKSSWIGMHSVMCFLKR